MQIITGRKKTKILLVYPNQMLQNLIPVNLSLLSACLKKEGFQVELFDTTFYKTEEESGDQIRVRNLQVRQFDLESFGIKIKKEDAREDFRKMVFDYQPDIIAYTITDDTFLLACGLMSAVKGYPAITIAGGAMATFAPEKVISSGLVDTVCVGEGEKALVELAYAVENKASYDAINNLWIKKQNGIIKNPLNKPIGLDTLPLLDLSIWQKERFYRPMQGKVYRMAPVYTDRGCPNLCTYCCASSYSKLYQQDKLGPYLRFRNVQNVIKEIEHFKKEYAVEYIYFSAETFLLLKEDLFDDLVREYRKIALPFWFQSRPENVTADRIKRLVNIGADRISVGLESGNEEYRRKILKRNFSNKEAIRCFDLLTKAGLKASVNNIIGFPDETRKMIFDTIRLNRSLKVDSISVFYFTPYSGTYLREYSIKKGYLEDDAKASDRRKESNLNMPQVSKKELEGLMRTFPMYVRFEEELYPQIEKAEKPDKEGDREFGRLSNIFKQRFFH